MKAEISRVHSYREMGNSFGANAGLFGIADEKYPLFLKLYLNLHNYRN